MVPGCIAFAASCLWSYASNKDVKCVKADNTRVVYSASETISRACSASTIVSSNLRMISSNSGGGNGPFRTRSTHCLMTSVHNVRAAINDNRFIPEPIVTMGLVILLLVQPSLICENA